MEANENEDEEEAAAGFQAEFEDEDEDDDGAGGSAALLLLHDDAGAPGPPHDRRVIVHIDLDMYYCQCEMLLDPSLRDKPVGIQQKYLVVTCNYLARERGVTKLQNIMEAKRRCPDLVIVNGEDLTHYRAFSAQIHEVLKRLTPKLERLGMDETFLDVTELVDRELASPKGDEDAGNGFVGHVYAPPSIEAGGGGGRCRCGCLRRLVVGSRLAAAMRKALVDELGFTSCAGVSTSKMLAKLAGEMHKPNAQTTLLPEDAVAYVSTLPARRLPGCGWSTNQQLKAMGIHTVTELRDTPLPTLAARLGAKQAALLLARARGHDPSPVQPSALAKSMSEEDSFKTCASREDAYRRLHELVVNLTARVEERRAEHNQVPHTVRLTLRRQRAEAGGTRPHRESRQSPLANPATLFGKPDASERVAGLFRVAKGLFERILPVSVAAFDLTLLNVCVTNFQPLASTAAAAAAATAGALPSSVRTKRRASLQQEGEAVVSPLQSPGAAADSPSSSSMLRYVRRSSSSSSSSFGSAAEDKEKEIPTVGAASSDNKSTGKKVRKSLDNAARRRLSVISVYTKDEDEDDDDDVIVVDDDVEGEGKRAETPSLLAARQRGLDVFKCPLCDVLVRECDRAFHERYHQEELDDQEEEREAAAAAAAAAVAAVKGRDPVAMDKEEEDVDAPMWESVSDDGEEEGEGEETGGEAVRRVVEGGVGMEWRYFVTLPRKVRRVIVEEAREREMMTMMEEGED